MPLKLVVEKLDDVPEALRESYVEKDGKYVLDADRDDLQTLFSDEIGGLKSALEKERDARKRFEQEAAKYRDVDPEKYAELVKAERERQGKEMIDAGKVDELVNQRTQEAIGAKDKELAAKSDEIAERDTLLDALIIERTIDAAALERGVREKSLPFVRTLAKTQWRRDGKAAVLQDESGNPVYGKDGKAKTPAEWIDELVAEHDYLLKDSKGTGSQEHGGSDSPPVGAKRSEMTPEQASDFIDKHGSEAYAALPQ